MKEQNISKSLVTWRLFSLLSTCVKIMLNITICESVCPHMCFKDCYYYVYINLALFTCIFNIAFFITSHILLQSAKKSSHTSFDRCVCLHDWYFSKSLICRIQPSSEVTLINFHIVSKREINHGICSVCIPPVSLTICFRKVF